MKLRWFTVYDLEGLDGETILQYWDTIAGRWLDVSSIRVSVKDEEEALKDMSFS